MSYLSARRRVVPAVIVSVCLSLMGQAPPAGAAAPIANAVPMLALPSALVSACQKNDTDPSVLSAKTLTLQKLSMGGAPRCIANKLRSTRGRIFPWCIAGTQALSLNVYPESGCNVPDGNQIEAIAQARAIAKFNLYNGLPGTGTRPGGLRSSSGVSPDVQWEVSDRNSEIGLKRADILLYDSSLALNTSVEIVEVKVEGNGSQVDAGQQAFDTATVFGGVVHDFNENGAYRDDFAVFRPANDSQCSNGFVNVEHYAAESLDGPGLEGVIWVSSQETHCVPIGTKLDTSISDENASQEPTGEEQPGTPPNPPPPPPPPGSKNFVDCIKDAAGVAQGASDWMQDGIGAAISATGGSFLSTLLMPPVTEVPVPEVMAQGADEAARLGRLRLVFGSAAVVAGVGLGLGVACGLKPNAFGDPHLITLDGLAYGIQAAGEFHMLRDPASGLDVQARFVPSGSSVSRTAAVAIRAGEHSVEFRNDGTVLIDGDATDLDADGFYLSEDSNLTVTRFGTDRFLALNDPNLLLRYKNGTLSVLMGNTPVEGLLGNHNGDPTDDLATSTGETPGPDANLRTFIHNRMANSWRIDQASSLFTYDDGESTYSFTDVNFPDVYVQLEDYEPAEIADAEAACADAEVGSARDACVLDVLATGTLEFVDDAVAAESAPVGLPADFDDQGQLQVDFEGTVPMNFQATKTTTGVDSSRFAGPYRAGGGAYEFSVPAHLAHSGLELGMDVLAIGDFSVARDRSLSLEVEDRYVSVTFTATTARAVGGHVSLVGTGTLDDGRPFRRYRLTTDTGPLGARVDAHVETAGFSRLQSDAIGFDNLSLELLDPAAPTVQPLELGDAVLPGGPLPNTIDSLGSRAVYQFTIPQDGTAIQIDPLPSSGDATSDCGEWQLTSLETSQTWPGCFYDPLQFNAGTYQLEISPAQDAMFPYEYAFHVHPTYPAQQFDPVDVGTGPVTFAADAGDTSGPGVILGSGDYHTYQLDVTESGLLNLDLECLDPDPSACGLRTSVYRDGSGGGVSLDRAVDVTPGRYTVHLSSRLGPHRYRLTLQVQQPVENPLSFGQVVRPASGNGLGVITTGHQRERFVFEVEETTPPLTLGLLYAFPVVTGWGGQDWVCESWRLHRLEDGESYGACLRGTQLPAGTYALDVFAPPSELLPYRYGFDVHTADDEPHQEFTTQVTSAAPVHITADQVSGEGVLQSADDSDTYTFTATEFGQLRVDLSCAGATENRCPQTYITPTGFSDPEATYTRPGVDYHVKVYGGDGGVHTYDLTLSVEKPNEYEVGEVVDDGTHGPGSGVLDGGRDQDLYAFTIPDGGSDVTVIGTGALGSWGVQLWNATTGDYVDWPYWERSAHLEAGDYVATIGPGDWWSDDQRPYSFAVLETPEPEEASIELGSVVAPVTVSDSLASSAATHRYSFVVATEGDYTVTSSETVTADLVAVPDEQQWVNLGARRVHLLAGSYEVEVTSAFDSLQLVDYTFGVNAAPPVDAAAYVLGSRVDPTTGSGLGILETAASVDELSFELDEQTAVALDVSGLSCNDVLLIDSGGSELDTGCSFVGFAAHLDSGIYRLRIAPGWDDPTDEPIAYSLTLRANPPVVSTQPMTMMSEHEGMLANVSGTVAAALDVNSFTFTLTETEAAEANYLILERGSGCVTFRLLRNGDQLASGTCENGLLYYPEAGDYELQVTGPAAEEFAYLVYSADEVPDGLSWPGGGTGT